MLNTATHRQSLRTADLGRTPRLRIHGIELATLGDPFQIDDWRTCRNCAAHTPHSGTHCLCCESLQVGATGSTLGP
jgi:hypothetical protein